MLNYTLNNINKTSYYILDNKNYLNINMTPFLFCSRNSIFLLDILKHVFLLRKSLFFFEKIFLERNRVMFLIENKDYKNSLFVNKFLNRYKESISAFLNSKKFKSNLKYNLYFLKNIITLKKNLNYSNFFFKKKTLYNLNFLKNKFYLYFYIKTINLKFIGFKVNSFMINNLELNDYLFLKEYNYNLNLKKFLKFGLKTNAKSYLKLYQYKFLVKNFKLYNKNLKNNLINNKFIKGRFFNLYEVNFKIFFKFYSLMLKLKKWLLFFKKFNNKIYLKKYTYLKSYIKLLNINVLELHKNKFKLNSLFDSNLSKNLGYNMFYKNLLYTYKYKFIENRFYFWFNSWLNGGITNFYGLKKTYKKKDSSFKKINYIPDFVIYFNLEKKDLFLSELFLYEIPSIGLSSLDMNPFFFTYYIPSNNKNILLFNFYFNLFLESSFRSLISDSKYFN